MRNTEKWLEKLITGLSLLAGAIVFPIVFPVLVAYWHFTEEKSNER